MSSESRITRAVVHGPEGNRCLQLNVSVNVNSGGMYHVTTDEFGINDQRDGMLAHASRDFPCEGTLTRYMAIWVAGLVEGLRIEAIHRQVETEVRGTLPSHPYDGGTGVPETQEARTRLPADFLKRLRLVRAGMPWDVVCALSDKDFRDALWELDCEQRDADRLAISKGDPDTIVARPLGGETTTSRRT